MTSISQIIKTRREQAYGQTPQEPKDEILKKVCDYLDKLDSNVQTVLTKAPLRINVSKSGKCTRYELSGKPFEIETDEGIDRLPVSLIVYEDKEGIKEAWYAAQDNRRNRVIIRQLVENHEVLLA